MKTVMGLKLRVIGRHHVLRVFDTDAHFVVRRHVPLAIMPDAPRLEFAGPASNAVPPQAMTEVAGLLGMDCQIIEVIAGRVGVFGRRESPPEESVCGVCPGTSVGYATTLLISVRFFASFPISTHCADLVGTHITPLCGSLARHRGRIHRVAVKPTTRKGARKLDLRAMRTEIEIIERTGGAPVDCFPQVAGGDTQSK
jgi:hypothetical protein